MQGSRQSNQWRWRWRWSPLWRWRWRLNPTYSPSPQPTLEPFRGWPTLITPHGNWAFPPSRALAGQRRGPHYPFHKPPMAVQARGENHLRVLNICLFSPMYSIFLSFLNFWKLSNDKINMTIYFQKNVILILKLPKWKKRFFKLLKY